jgi:hypothetical protein
MSPAALIAEVAALGATLTRRGGEIALDGASLVPADLKEEIRARKPELLAHLAEERAKFSRPNGFQGCLWPVSNGTSFRWCGAEVGDPAVDEYCAKHEKRLRN